MPDPNDELFRTVVELLPVGVLVVDRGGTVVLSSRQAERLLGHEPGQLSGCPLDRLVAAADRARLSERLDEAHAERDIHAVRRDGPEIRVDVRVIPFEASGEHLTLLVVCDASERRNLQDERRHVQKPPAAGTLARPAAGRAASPPDDVSARPEPHILLVEDEETLAELGKRQLQADGFHVSVHTSSIHALEEFRARPDAFDLVITDNTMPKMSGMALAHEILRLRPRMRILLVSGLAETLDPGVIYAKGIGGLLGKPHTGQELTAAVRSLLELTDRRLPGDDRQ